MPFTAFHLAAGLLPKAIAPRQFSYAAFAMANVLLDLEPGFKLVLVPDAAALHSLHTWGVAAIVAFAAFAMTWSPHGRGMLPAALGAVVGAFSHILLDAIYHVDVAHNLGLPLPDYETTGFVEAACLVAGVHGLLLIGLRYISARANMSGQNSAEAFDSARPKSLRADAPRQP